jgi:hypothetical protein
MACATNIAHPGGGGWPSGVFVGYVKSVRTCTVLLQVHHGGAERWPATVPWRQRHRPALHSTEDAG